MAGFLGMLLNPDGTLWPREGFAGGAWGQDLSAEVAGAALPALLTRVMGSHRPRGLSERLRVLGLSCRPLVGDSPTQ